MKTKREKTTILFVNKTAQGIKPMQISSQLILNWKKYLLVVVVVFAGLIGTIVFLTSHDLRQVQIQESLVKKMQSMHVSFAQIDTMAIKKKFTNINLELSTINGYLRARGIKSPIKEPEGGESDHDIISADEISDFYQNYLSKIIYNISYTPLGFP